MKFVFISGSHKSGTSWLAKMVSTHPAIGIAPQELWLLGNENSLIDRIEKDIEAWLTLGTVAQAFKSKAQKRRVTNSILRAAVRGAISPTLDNASQLQMIGDKTPYFYAIHAKKLHRLFPQGFFVHIVRDPRDVFVSHHFHAYRLQEWGFFGDAARARDIAKRIENGDEVGPDLLDEAALARLSRTWVETQTGAETARDLFGEHYIELRYEDLLERPAPEMTRVFAGLQSPVSPAQLSDILDQTTFKALSGGRSSGQSDPSSFFRKGVSGDWRAHFSDAQAAAVAAACGDVAARFGYRL